MIPFAKYHGLGNDFILVDYHDLKQDNPSVLARLLCDRHTGIGADGLIIVKQDPLEMIYYNSDGSRAKMCGNGIRCFANYVVDNHITKDQKFSVQTLAGDYQITVDTYNPFTCTVNMGKPDFIASNIPVTTEEDTFIQQDVVVDQITYNITSVFMGTIHTTVEVEDLDNTDIVRVGTGIQALSIFPDSTNVNVYQVINETTVKMQTYERGAGLTLACGTGATAVYSVLNRVYKKKHPITFQLPLGNLELQEINQNIYMTGPAEYVFQGTYQPKGRD